MKMFCQIKTDTTETEPPTNTSKTTISNLQEYPKIKCNVNPCDSDVSTSISHNYCSYIPENSNPQETSIEDLGIIKIYF